MPRTYKSRPITKVNQLVLRLNDKTIRQLEDIVSSQPFKTTRVAVIESLIDDEHAKLKGKK